ncbi:MAG: AMP-binding protein [Deltaproteobacteria bacterium]|nr:AMP-binding protein [Deltaproteobacteria bacterium]
MPESTPVGDSPGLSTGLENAGPDRYLPPPLHRLYIKLALRPEYRGLQHLESLSSPGMIISNRASLLDAALILSVCPHPLRVVLDELWAGNPLLKKLGLSDFLLPVNLQKPFAEQGVKEALEKGERLLIFPELIFTRAGSITEVSDEAGRFIVEAGLPVVPAILDGPQYSRYGLASRHVHNLPKKYPTVVTFFPPRKISLPEREGESRRSRARRCGDAVYHELKDARFWAKDFKKNLWTALEDAARRYGKNRLIVEDHERKPLSYARLMRSARLYALRFEELTRRGERVGIMLPNCLHNAISLFGLWSVGRVPVILNYTQGPALLNTAVETSEVKTVLTSRRFIAETGLEKAAAGLKAKLAYVEDFAFDLGDEIAARLRSPTPESPESPAVIVFTSGSEGKPKGVVHSHRGLLANEYQTTCHLEYSEDDVFFDPMPLFHTIGLNMLLLTPVLQGMYSFLYLNPLHPHRIPKLIYELGATMVVASDTFANAWAREAHPRDFSSLRVLLAGSERIKEKTHERFFKDFGLRLYEGYGVSEAAPVTCVSTQMRFKQGPCGNFLPGIQHRLEPVEGIERGGELHIKGPNIMLGYLFAGQPGVIHPPEDGWHNTGDIVEVDDDGYVWIKGRHKRFAKVGGEMISLVAVEEVINQLWPGKPQAVLAVEDENKGERLVLATEESVVDVVKLRDSIRAAGLPEIAVPRQFVTLEKIPLNPVGKLNFPELKSLLEKILQERAEKKAAEPAPESSE